MAPAPSASRTRYKRKEEPRMELHCGCNASNSNESWNINNGQDYNNGEDISVTVCSTPKAQRFRIPEMLSCPPAPKKRRVTSSFVSDSNIRSPIPFFAPPEIELFFFLAFQNIPLWVDSYLYEKFDYEVTSTCNLTDQRKVQCDQKIIFWMINGKCSFSSFFSNCTTSFSNV